MSSTRLYRLSGYSLFFLLIALIAFGVTFIATPQESNTAHSTFVFTEPPSLARTEDTVPV